jgi:methylmalonyl-CoA mutase
MIHSRPDSLFHEFPAVSREEWKKKAISELKETPYDSIVWHTPDGFAQEPWHSSEETKQHLDIPASKSVNTWKNCCRIIVHDPDTANRDALKSFELDAAAIEFQMADASLCSPENLNRLLAGIKTTAVAIHFSGNLPPAEELLKTLVAIPGFSVNSGGMLSGAPAVSKEQDAELFGLCKALPQFRFLAVDTIPFHEKGSTAAQEIACALAGASDYLHRFIEAGVPAESIVAAMEIIMPVGSSHFTELAKPRALRYLLGHLLKAYKASGSSLPPLFARTSERNHSLLDPYTNVLRLTTEAVSAILGGYDTLQIGAFDTGLSVTPDIAERITGNIHLILKEEGSLDQVVDPADGSNYIEALTRNLAETAWNIFKEIEAVGGLAEAVQSGMIDSMIAEAETKRRKTLENRKKTLIGVNRYPWPLTPEQESNIGALKLAAEKMSAGNEIAGYELVRMKTLSHGIKSGRTPSIFIWMLGDPVVSFRQATFAEDLFNCGGFVLAGKAALPFEENSYQSALENKPDIVVLCIAERDPVPTAEVICNKLRSLEPNIIIVMAGKPPKAQEKILNAGLDSFIYTGVNVLDMLKSYQHKTGVK